MGLGDRMAAAVTRLWGGPAPVTTQASAYYGARQHRRLSKWQPTSASINAILAWSGVTLRNRTRDLVRNNPYARSAVEYYIANAVGCGIKPSSAAPDRASRAEIRQLWSDWTDEADADGVTDFYGLQALGVRAMIEAGEFFVRRRLRRPEDGLVVPLQLQLLEADQLPLDDNRTLGSGNVVKCGIEFDAIGRRVAYHFLRRHPGEMIDFRTLSTFERVRVPASDVLHVFKPLRPGQIRGEPQFVTALVRLFLVDEYEDAELDRKKVAALFAGFITTPADADNPVEADDEDEEEPTVTLEPGLVQRLRTGEKMEFSEPADVGANFEAFLYRMLLACAAGCGVPYSSLTGDVRQANYSSLRAALVDFRGRIEPFQHSVLAFQMGRVVWRWFLDVASLSGALSPPAGDGRAAWRRVKWIPPKLAWVDPKKDLEAEILAVDNCIKSLSDVIEATGEEPEDVFQRIAEERARMKELGIERRPANAMIGHNGGPSLDDDESAPPEGKPADRAEEDAA